MIKAKKKAKNVISENINEQNVNIINSETPFAITEAYKSLRTNIIFSTGDAGCKKYVITSPMPGEGKTTNAVNLAISFAETGKNVLLIDGDLRKPRIHKFFNLDNKNGLSNVLSGIFEEKDNKNYICNTNLENLDIITAGHIPPNPIELLSSENMGELIKDLEDKYDFIIIDTPPVNVVSDALVLSKHVTGYILVTRSNYTVYQNVDIALSKFELANVKPLGVILNDYNENKMKYSSRYRQYKGYNYYYYSK